MIVYGGQFENGSFSGELLNFDLEYYDWSYISFKQHVEPFSNGACASVASVKSKSLTRLSDTVLDGIYYFEERMQNESFQPNWNILNLLANKER